MAAAAFMMEAKSANSRAFEILAYAKDPQEAKINPEHCTTARLISSVYRRHVEPYYQSTNQYM